MLENLFPQPYHLALKWLSTKSWLKVDFNPELGTVCNVSSEITVTAEDAKIYKKEDIERAKSLLEHYAVTASTALYVKMLSDAIGMGPKLFRPTMDQCLALENTEIKVPFNFYKQPFSTTILEIPKEYRSHLKEQFEIEPPRYVVSYRHEDTGTIVVAAVFGIDDVIVNVLSPREEYADIEDALVKNRTPTSTDRQFEILKNEYDINVDQPSEDVTFTLAEITQRLGINFSLMMTLLGVKMIGPANTSQHKYEKNLKIAESKQANDEKKYRANKNLASTVILTEFEQKIDLFDIEDNRPLSDRARDHETKSSPRPHWRRGHFRMQAHGPERALRKMIFIRPVLVMASTFKGELADTKATYTIKKKGT